VRVKLPDDRVAEFPDDMSPADVEVALGRQTAQQGGEMTPLPEPENLWESAKQYYHWLHMPADMPKDFNDFVSNVYKSISATTVGLVEFPYQMIKSFTDPLFQASGAKDFARMEAQAAWHNLTGISRFMGEPLGLYGLETAKKRWLTDPAGAVVGVAPFIRGAVRGRLPSAIDVEAPYQKMGAPETGFHVKNRASKSAMIEEVTIENVRDVSRLAQNDPKILQQSPLYAESIGATKNAPANIKPVAEYAVDYFERSKQEYRNRGVNVDFKARIIGELNDLLGEAKEAEAPKIEKALEVANDLQFVHIPTALWFEERLGDPAGRQQVLKLLATQKRKTLNIRQLLKEEKIKPEQINMADIIASYGRRKARDFALLDIVDAAAKEGLASIKPVPNYVKLPAHRAGVLAKYHLHPAFADQIYDLVRRRGGMNPIEKAMVTTKMTAFYNPLFLPMYDVVQQAMATQLGFPKALWKTARGLRSPLSFREGIRSAVKQDAAYWEALDNGLASKPFNNPWSSYMEWAQAVQKSAPQRLLEIAKSPFVRPFKGKGIFGRIPILPDIYNLSWHVAWELDKAVRMGTYRYLRESRGYSARDAAQTAAKFHSDYASVPAKTRKVLNHIFFTPTFKITMGKLYGKMIKDAVSMKPSRYAGGLVAAVSILHGMDMFFQGLGFERDEWGRRYVKRVDEKEVVITWSSPANMFLKYAYRFVDAVKSPEPIQRYMRTNRWEIHPMWRVASDLALSKDAKGNTIYDWKLDGPTRSGEKMVWYATKELLAILGTFDPEQTDEAGRKAFAKETGQLLELATRPFTFKYTRKPEEQRIAGKMVGFTKHFRRFLMEKLRMKQAWTPENIENFQREMNRLRQELEEARKR
jgi:hypothetical protein